MIACTRIVRCSVSLAALRTQSRPTSCWTDKVPLWLFESGIRVIEESTGLCYSCGLPPEALRSAGGTFWEPDSSIEWNRSRHSLAWSGFNIAVNVFLCLFKLLVRFRLNPPEQGLDLLLALGENRFDLRCLDSRSDPACHACDQLSVEDTFQGVEYA